MYLTEQAFRHFKYWKLCSGLFFKGEIFEGHFNWELVSLSYDSGNDSMTVVVLIHCLYFSLIFGLIY